MAEANETAPQSRLRLEAIIASPPTKKCRATLKLMEEMTRRFPDEVRLDVYDLGRNWPRLHPPCHVFSEYRRPGGFPPRTSTDALSPRPDRLMPRHSKPECGFPALRASKPTRGIEPRTCSLRVRRPRGLFGFVKPIARI